MNSFLDQDIMYLKGVGPKRAELLANELEIHSYRDLLYHFPYKYIDRSKIYKINEIDTSLAFIQVKGVIKGFKTEGPPRKKRLIAHFSDDTGSIQLIWFQGINWVIKNFTTDTEYIVFGRPGIYNRSISIAHPEIEPVEKMQDGFNAALSSQYNTTEKLKNSYVNSKTLQRLIASILFSAKGKIEETIPGYLINKSGLLSYEEAMINIHFPADSKLLEKAIFRLKFEELFLLQLSILKLKINHRKKTSGLVFEKVGDNLNTFYKQNLPFELTNAQKRVIKEIRKDLGSGKQMNRLLQGDVGSGKTLVALMCMLIALDNGYQSCLMAPTEILAKQHFETISNFLRNMNVNVKLLTGSSKRYDREILHKELQSKELNILIGTHALIEDRVQFNNLGLVVIDEQHRFGVAQRARLWKKNEGIPPHILVMTATPIPRTLAMTLYGDLDVSVIDELPSGRKPIKTYHYNDSKRLPMFGFLKKQIDQGRQIYVVYPMIKESEKMDYKYLEDGYEGFKRAFPPPGYIVTCVHGQMKSEEKDASMKLFTGAKSQILIATTVIEVGVDIPNATVMVIESAERFGLSQLHQLRGRVGRGGNQSYCILMTSNKLTKEAKKRISTMVETNDGFEIAEVDLKLRGPGNIEGTQQSGIPFDLKLSNLAHDGQLIQYSRDLAQQLLNEDPELEKQENKILLHQLKSLKKTIVDWSVIS